MSDEQTPRDDAENIDPNTDANKGEVTTDDNTTPTTQRNRTGITSVTSDAGDDEGGSGSGSA